MLRRSKTKTKTGKPKAKPQSASRRMHAYRRRMRAEGFRSIQIWVPDTKSPAFKARCERISRAIAAHDPGGDEIMREIEVSYEWPPYEW